MAMALVKATTPVRVLESSSDEGGSHAGREGRDNNRGCKRGAIYKGNGEELRERGDWALSLFSKALSSSSVLMCDKKGVDTGEGRMDGDGLGLEVKDGSLSEQRDRKETVACTASRSWS